MAILTVLMAAIMRMFKPIRETYVDSTLYENQRTVQNGIVQYVSESLRYATDIGVYNESNMSAAVEEFAKAYCRKNTKADKETIKKNAEVIVIDNTTNAYTFNGKSCTGRVLRRNNVGTSTWSDANTRIALGAAYYGENDYAIKLSKPDEIVPYPGTYDPEETEKNNEAHKEWLDWKAKIGVKITVASTASYGRRRLQNSESFVDGGSFNDKLIKSEGLVVCPNLSKLNGLFDVMKDAPAGGGGGGEGGDAGGGGGGEDDESGRKLINGCWSDDKASDPDADPDAGDDPDNPASYVDNKEYDSDLAVVPNSKVYIVFLTK
ncbi:MAG: hypothetical protein K2G87_02330 [Oscillospiraceae bacterium]|nr:hypothetical protein [Oscillospiraceae bacterium]